MPSPEIRVQHSALTGGVGFSDLSNRTQVELVGKDRVQLLHGLCTNDIKSLNPGEGCEAFLTNVQGKTIAYVYVFCDREGLVVESVPGQSSAIIQSLDRYVIREDVKFWDRGLDWCEFLVSGPESPSMLKQAFGVEAPSKPFQHVTVNWQSASVTLRRVPFTGPFSFFLAAQRSLAEPLERELIAAGAVRCQAEAVEIARIEAGSPLFGKDITADNLPQEVGRSEQAISFKKGCYLGQETVARIDALGHVNRTLRGLRFSPGPVGGESLPPADLVGEISGKPQFTVTSVCWSFLLDAPLALAYVRRGMDKSPDVLFGGRTVEVVDLPLRLSSAIDMRASRNA